MRNKHIEPVKTVKMGLVVVEPLKYLFGVLRFKNTITTRDK